MTPQQALTKLDQVAAMYPGTREQHMDLQEAVNTLKATLDGYTAAKGENPGAPPVDPMESELE